ncbi:hypothetical protein [Candidatus Hamiltonella defensa]|nr:hypothetical protein [Candidatus Hamiltonella defensa]
MNIKINYLIKNFKNDENININLINENKFIIYIKNFFYQIITLGLKRSLYEAKSEDKKELFNIAFSVYASLPQSFLKINENYTRDMYFSPDKKYKIHQFGYKIYISKLNEKDEIIDSRTEIADLSNRDKFEKFKKKFQEIKKHDDYQKKVDNNYNIISKLNYKEINFLSDFRKVIINYVIENYTSYVDHIDGINSRSDNNLKEKVISLEDFKKKYKETPTPEYIAMDDIATMMDYFFIENQELTKELLEADVHEYYMYEFCRDYKDDHIMLNFLAISSYLEGIYDKNND